MENFERGEILINSACWPRNTYAELLFFFAFYSGCTSGIFGLSSAVPKSQKPAGISYFEQRLRCKRSNLSFWATVNVSRQPPFFPFRMWFFFTRIPFLSFSASTAANCAFIELCVVACTISSIIWGEVLIPQKSARSKMILAGSSNMSSNEQNIISDEDKLLAACSQPPCQPLK